MQQMAAYSPYRTPQILAVFARSAKIAATAGIDMPLCGAKLVIHASGSRNDTLKNWIADRWDIRRTCAKISFSSQNGHGGGRNNASDRL